MSWGVLGSFEYGGQATGPLPFSVAAVCDAVGTANVVQGVRVAATCVGEMVGAVKLSQFGLGDFSETMRRPRQDRTMRRPMHEN